jgi:hypothetical protein
MTVRDKERRRTRQENLEREEPLNDEELETRVWLRAIITNRIRWASSVA